MGVSIKKLYLLSPVILVFGLLGVVKAGELLPRVSTACELKNGQLFAMDDGFSLHDKCEGEGRRVVLIGEKGDKGDTGAVGATGPAGVQGEKGDPGPATKIIKVFDKNNQKLGIFVDVNNGFYYEPLGKIVRLDIYEDSNTAVIKRVPVYFKFTQCSGPAYIPVPYAELNQKIHEIFSTGPNIGGLTRYYAITNSAPETFVAASYYHFNRGENVSQCDYSNENVVNGRLLNTVPVTLTEPFLLPLKYKLD